MMALQLLKVPAATYIDSFYAIIYILIIPAVYFTYSVRSFKAKKTFTFRYFYSLIPAAVALAITYFADAGEFNRNSDSSALAWSLLVHIPRIIAVFFGASILLVIKITHIIKIQSKGM